MCSRAGQGFAQKHCPARGTIADMQRVRQLNLVHSTIPGRLKNAAEVRNGFSRPSRQCNGKQILECVLLNQGWDGVGPHSPRGEETMGFTGLAFSHMVLRRA